MPQKNKFPHFNKFAAIKVLWEDFSMHGGWHPRDGVVDHLKDPYLVESIGFLMAWNKDRLVLATGVTPCGDLQDVMTVPRGIIKKITYLGESRGVPKSAFRIKRANTKKQPR
jgi:hypothetical protein